MGNVFGKINLFVSINTDKQDDEAIRNTYEKINDLTVELEELLLKDSNGNDVSFKVEVHNIDLIEWDGYEE